MQMTISPTSQGGLPEATQALLLKKALKQEQASQQRLIDSASINAGEEQAEPAQQSESSEGETVGRYLNAKA